MKTNRAFWISLVVVIGTAPLAFAKPMANENAPADGALVQPLPKASTLADNVVVGTPSAPAPAQPVPVVEQPAPAPPVVVDPEPRRVVHVDTTPPRNYMSTIAINAFMGGVAGVLVGGAIYYLGSQNHPYNVAYWGAGGVLLGTGVGLMQIMVQESRASQATALSNDPAPTLRLALYQTRF
jgi:hypothetical protein